MHSRSEHARWWAVPVLAGALTLLAACGSTTTTTTPPSSPTSTPASAGSPASSSGAVTIKTASTSVGTVLTNASGHTLYWFAIDTSTKSNCNGSCANYWTPVLGSSASVSGTTLSGHFGTITRSNGQKQLTYDGHPLYTYVGDTAAGQTSGNGKNLSGGLWWAITPSGSKPAGSSPSPSSSSPSSSGYGY
jgi:predicted lipoprotein with Yx(FWY)xxD motif